MHKWAKCMADSLKAKVDELGVSNIDGELLCDLEKWSAVIKNIACFEKDYLIIEAMEESDADENAKAFMEMDEDYPKRYYNHNRYKNGRYAPKGHGRIRGYVEPEYHDMTDMEGMERMRDMDANMGRMYYTEPINSNESDNTHVVRDSREGRSGMMRRTYMESKEVHTNGTAEDKKAKMQELEKYADTLKDDIKDMTKDMSSEERQMLKTKLANMSTML